MKLIKVDFAPPHPARRWAVRAAYLAVVLSVAIGGAGIGHRTLELFKQEQARDAALQELAQLQHSRAELKARISQVPPYFKDAGAYAKLMQFPLNGLLAGVEAAGATDVKALTLDISASAGSARLALDFGSQESLSKYLDALGDGKVGKWKLVKVTAAPLGPGGTAELAWGQD